MKPKKITQSTFADQLEAFASSRTPCAIVYTDENDQQQHSMGLIIEFFHKGETEFLKLDNSTEIRVDKIISANGLAATDFDAIC